MEDIIQLLVIMGVLFIDFVFQNKKKKRQMPEEAFPPVFDYEEEEEEEIKQHPKQQTGPFIPSFTQTESVRSTSHYTPVTLQKGPIQPSTPITNKEGTERRINLRSPQKAREAFIYSEIFTRKYK